MQPRPYPSESFYSFSSQNHNCVTKGIIKIQRECVCPLQNHVLQESSGEVMGTSATVLLPATGILSKKTDLKNFLGDHFGPINILFTVFYPLQVSERPGVSICQSKTSRFRSGKRVRRAEGGKKARSTAWMDQVEQRGKTLLKFSANDSHIVPTNQLIKKKFAATATKYGAGEGGEKKNWKEGKQSPTSRLWRESQARNCLRTHGQGFQHGAEGGRRRRHSGSAPPRAGPALPAPRATADA